MKRCALIAVMAVALALAATGAQASEGWIPPDWKDFLWRILNVIIFLGIIYFLFGQRIKQFFSGRREQIRTEIENIETRKAEAEKKLRDVEQRIANLESERQEILDQAREQGEKIKQSIIEKAHSDAEQIRKQAQLRASQELEQEVQNLRHEMADQIVDSAERIIKQRLGASEQEELIDKYLTKVVLN